MMVVSRIDMSRPGDPDSSRPQHAYSRKEKSLGLLCINFLRHYTQEHAECISLDEAACVLGVERRRIYDIVNVLESVGVLMRKAKNSYSWKGFEGIPKALDMLKEAGLRGEVLTSWRHPTELFFDDKHENTQDCVASDDDEENSSNENCCPLDRDERGVSNKFSPISVLNELTKSKADCRREKSLGLLTQKFVQLFLVTQAEIVSLDEAARLLIGECNEPAKLKTKVRRLYDIANILSSLNLIEKTHSAENRKPAFKWLGLKGNISASFYAEAETKKRQFGTVLSMNTTVSVSDSERLKRGRPSYKLAVNSGNDIKNSESQSGGGTATEDLKPKPKSKINAGESIYNPTPVYPSEGSLSSIPVGTSGPKVSTGLTLGTPRGGAGWKEWSTTASPNSKIRDRDCPSSDFTYGPFCPFKLQQQCLASLPAALHKSENSETREAECSSQESEVINPFSQTYKNERLDDMFGHYASAWRSWYVQAAKPPAATAAPHKKCDSISKGQSYSL